MTKHHKKEINEMIQRGVFLIQILLIICFLSNCSITIRESTSSSRNLEPVISSRQEVSITGDLSLIVSGFLPEPILQAGETRYRLEVTANSSLPPDMSYDNMVGWRAGRYHAQGYLSGKMTDVWNPSSRQLEKTPVLSILRLTRIEKPQEEDPCKDPNLKK